MPATRPLVLCLDDNPDLARRLQSRLASRVSCDAIVADSNDRALELIEMYGSEIKLVVQDMVRPPGRCLPTGELSFIPEVAPLKLAWNAGLVFYDRFLAEGAAHRPCVFYTAETNPWVVQQINGRVGAHYVPKHDTVDELCTVVGVLLRDREHRTAGLIRVRPIILADMREMNDEWLAHLARNPGGLHELTDRQFEELIAHLFSNHGWSVELTRKSRDGGYDVRAVQKDGVVPILCVVECKKYRPDRRVGVELVRQLRGVKEAEGANVAVLATTSYFTDPAIQEERKAGFGLHLKDYDAVTRWITECGGAEGEANWLTGS